MSGRHLIYFADPMCSWCWGFAPVIAAVREVWGDALPVRLVMGGLRPGTTEAMTDAAKSSLRGHWAEVTRASGQPFGSSGLDTHGFVYDTDPAARAVVVFRREQPTLALDYLAALQRAFYAEGGDVTDTALLAFLAARLGPDADAFAEALAQDESRQETWRDYAISRGAGVTGFPTLIYGPRSDGTYVAVARGFQPVSIVLPAIAALLDQGA